MMNENTFVRKYRKAFGCHARGGETCWCEVCAMLGVMYRDLVTTAANGMLAAMGVDRDWNKVPTPRPSHECTVCTSKILGGKESQ